MSEVTKKLRSLKYGVGRKRRRLTNEEAVEIIRSYRRGVPMAAIAEALGNHRRSSIYSMLGSWALREAPIAEGKP